MLIFRRKNCIIIASGPLATGILYGRLQRVMITRCCNNTICPPEDEQGTAQNMLRIIM